MSEIIEYKCPCCGGAVNFDSSRQKMKCPYCDTEFDIEAITAYNEDLEKEQAEQPVWENHAGGEWQDGETDGMRIYRCESCGGEIVGDENTGAATCPPEPASSTSTVTVSFGSSAGAKPVNHACVSLPVSNSAEPVFPATSYASVRTAEPVPSFTTPRIASARIFASPASMREP